MLNTTLIYLEKGNDILLLHRVKKKNDINKDKWIGVGGKCEEDESPEDCALRETFEETGLTVTDLRYRGVVTFVSNEYEGEYMHLFTATDWKGELKDCDEGELVWVSRENVMELPTWEGDYIFLKLLFENSPFFSLKLCYEGSTLASKELHVYG